MPHLPLATVVVMGVSGSGKTTVGRALAARLGRPYVEGDDLHPPANVAKMRAGVPLDDADRAPWLDAVAARAAALEAAGTPAVVTCSALRRRYRDRLRAAAPQARFVELDVDPAVLGPRVAARQGHFMPPSLLGTQLAALEPLGADEAGVRVTAQGPAGAVVDRVLAALGGWAGRGPAYPRPVPTLTLTSDPAASLPVDALVVGLAQGPDGPVLDAGSGPVDDALGGRLLDALVALGATGRAGETTRLVVLDGGLPPVVVAAGLGSAAQRTPETVRRACGEAVRALAGTARAGVLLALDDAASLRAVCEGALLGAYAFTAFRSAASLSGHREPVQEVLVAVADAADEQAVAAAARAEVVARAVRLARDLVNTPASHLHPADLAEVARTECGGVGLDVEVLDEAALAEGGFGGIVGVGQGAEHPPRLVHVAYRGGGPKVALVGKGITFDSGGLSLKPPAAMEEMKSDMGGAAAVLATMTAVARLGLVVDVDAWVPMAENMPSGTATRPSDVLTMRGGRTVEVNNTDAEGRLILADAITRACEDGPQVLVDAATLTGAQLVALGARTAGVMGNDDDLRRDVVDAAGRAGEAAWPMPLPPELRKGLDSEVADLVNTGPREGGMLTAGLFLQEFVAEGVRWAHLDIAGPAFHGTEPYGYTPKGGTGFGVRTLVQVLEDLAGA